jgi:hypothetical protein
MLLLGVDWPRSEFNPQKWTPPTAQHSEYKAVGRREQVITETIRACYVSADSIGVLPKRAITKERKLMLEACCAKLYAFRTKKPGRPVVKLLLHQPDLTRLYELLSQSSWECPMVINELHVALDLCLDTLQEADELFTWIIVRLRNPNMRRSAGTCGGTAYFPFGRRWRQIQIVVYLGYSKVSGEPCVRIECRIQGAGRIRRLGILAIRDILDGFDVRAFWKRHLILEEPKLDALAGFLRRRADRRSGRRRSAGTSFDPKEFWKNPDWLSGREFGIFLRANNPLVGCAHLSVSGVRRGLYRMGVTAPARFFTPVDFSHLIPSAITMCRSSSNLATPHQIGDK